MTTTEERNGIYIHGEFWFCFVHYPFILSLFLFLFFKQMQVMHYTKWDVDIN